MGRKKSRNRKLKIASKIPSKASTAAAASSAVPPPPPPPWIELPGDVTANILGRLGAEEILRSARSVCTTWWKVCQDPAMWRVIHLLSLERDYWGHSIMCRRAVDLSQGQLVDLTLENVGDDELIDYIAQRSSNLKRLTIDSCYDMSGECLAEAVKKLPQLEELHITIAPGLEGGDIKNIGISCPKLKSFSFNERGSRIRFPIEDDDILGGFDLNEHGLAIGKSMPNLRHLQLFANCMRNPGLEAILDGCPHLESLDIRQCFELDLGGDIGKRCRDQIKSLKLPSDSISDVPRLVYEPSECNPYEYEYDSCCDQPEDDYDFYDDYETYDDFTSPYGFGFFDNDLHALIHPEVFDPDYF